MKNDDVGAEIWSEIREQLKNSGFDIGELCCQPGQSMPKVKVVCVKADIGESLRELSRTPRDQVVMVRVDADTCAKLDQWVETGAAKSRSEAAALFIREGLNVRSEEFEQLAGPLRDLEDAKRRLRQKARDILGESTDNGDTA